MHRAPPVADFQTHTEEARYLVVNGSIHNHTGEAQHLSSNVPQINQTGVSRTRRHAPPSHIYVQHFFIKARAVSYHYDCLSGRKSHTLPMHIPINGLTNNTKPQNIRNAKYPQTSIEQPHTTKSHQPAVTLVVSYRGHRSNYSVSSSCLLIVSL